MSRKTALLFRAVWPLGVCDPKRYKKFLGYAHKYSPIYLEKDIFLDFNEIANERKILIARYKKDKNYFLRLAKKCERDGKKLFNFSLSVKKKDVSKMSNDELVELFSTTYGRVIDFDIYLMAPIAAQQFFEETIDAELQKRKFPPHKRKFYRNLLCAPLKHNTGYYEQKNIILLSLEYRDTGLTRFLEKKIMTHALRYGHIGCKNGIGSAWTRGDVLKRIQFLSQKDPKRKWDDLRRHDRSVASDVHTLLNAFHASPAFRKITTIARTYVYLRTFRTDVISGSFANMMPLVAEIGKRFRFTPAEILLMLPTEIASTHFPTRAELQNRKFIVLKGDNGILYFDDGKAGKKFIHAISAHFAIKKGSRAKKITGSIANPGIVSGRVKILHDNTELNKVREGDILVASMTTPDFVPAMERAAAFVTDEGGILCHAAILSREMDKPCIIGTKNATRILKDNERIEVNANTGVVRLLSARKSRRK